MGSRVSKADIHDEEHERLSLLGVMSFDALSRAYSTTAQDAQVPHALVLSNLDRLITAFQEQHADELRSISDMGVTNKNVLQV